MTRSSGETNRQSWRARPSGSIRPRVRQFVDELLDADPEANIIVLGDLNDFWFSPPLETLTAGSTEEESEPQRAPSALPTRTRANPVERTCAISETTLPTSH
jgi:hypothetical protein